VWSMLVFDLGSKRGGFLLIWNGFLALMTRESRHNGEKDTTDCLHALLMISPFILSSFSIDREASVGAYALC
jgi:hypothetical protein